MSGSQKRVFLLTLGIGLVYFVIFLWPNATGAADPQMISIFEPDESAQYSHPLRMITPGKSFDDSLRKLINYQHYYYGYPFYISSALVLLPVKLVGGLGNTPVNMLLLRQAISVLPMIFAAITLVYLQTDFRSYLSSGALLVFLLTVPAVFKNSAWWHPDSLLLLFIALTFFFLDRDRLRFGRNFTFAAIACGLATGTKLIGLFFFLAVPVYILAGYLQKRITLWVAVRSAILFVLVMGLTFILVNPFLLNESQRLRAIQIQVNQAEAMSLGWSVLYSQGPLAWYPMIAEMYGHLLTIALVFSVIGLSIWRGHKRLLNILVLAFALPFLVYVLFTIVIKPTHFLLPAALPLYSSLAAVFIVIPPPRISRAKPWIERSQVGYTLLFALVVVILGLQFYQNLRWDASYYRHHVNRERESEEVVFARELNEDFLAELPWDLPLNVFRDVRAYLPANPHWALESRGRPIDYDFIQAEDIQLIVLWNQRALDYTNEGVLEQAIDRAAMERSYEFYTDVRAGDLDGFVLLARSECCSAFLREDLYQEYFSAESHRGKFDLTTRIEEETRWRTY